MRVAFVHLAFPVGDGMTTLALFVCSYGRDLLRAERLVESVERHNPTSLDLYIAVPQAHLRLFQDRLGSSRAEWLTQESVYAQTPSATALAFTAVPGGILQQVVKAEAWRLGIAENLLVLDSDCVFIRDFGESDFVDGDGVPITVLEAPETVQQLSERLGQPKVWTDWLATSDRARALLRNTDTARYCFGGAPFIWSCKVWRDLDQRVLTPRRTTLVELIVAGGSELVIYGESALAFRSIPLRTRGQLFKLYLYEAEYWRDRADGIAESDLASSYLGVVYQSNWQEELDHPDFRRPLASRVRRVLRRTASHTAWMVRRHLGLDRRALRRCSP